MAKSKIIDIDEIRKHLKYDPQTGELTRIKPVRGQAHGKPVGSKRKTRAGDAGWISVCLNYRHYKAHRLAWVLHTGHQPPEIIDHINGNPFDNRWVNLREATGSENMWNSKTPRNNKSGFKGVSWRTKDKCWIASVAIKGKQVYYKAFKDFEEACDAVVVARQEAHKEFCRD